MTIYYDPNLFNSGNLAKQTIRLTFAIWGYSKTMEVEMTSNIPGYDAIGYAIEKVLEALPMVGPDDDQINRIVLESAEGDTLTCDDDEDEWDEWLKKMLVSAEIVKVEPAGRIGDAP